MLNIDSICLYRYISRLNSKHLELWTVYSSCWNVWGWREGAILVFIFRCFSFRFQSICELWLCVFVFVLCTSLVLSSIKHCVKYNGRNNDKHNKPFALQYDWRAMTRTRFHFISDRIFCNFASLGRYRRRFFFVSSTSSYWSLNLDQKIK